jgi:hypothetical protein
MRSDEELRVLCCVFNGVVAFERTTEGHLYLSMATATVWYGVSMGTWDIWSNKGQTGERGWQ